MTKTLLLDCGSGGRASQRLINELFLEQFDNPILRTLDDAAKLELSGPIAMSTDGYTVTPLFFPGGNIGTWRCTARSTTCPCSARGPDI